VGPRDQGETIWPLSIHTGAPRRLFDTGHTPWPQGALNDFVSGRMAWPTALWSLAGQPMVSQTVNISSTWATVGHTSVGVRLRRGRRLRVGDELGQSVWLQWPLTLTGQGYGEGTPTPLGFLACPLGAKQKHPAPSRGQWPPPELGPLPRSWKKGLDEGKHAVKRRV